MQDNKRPYNPPACKTLPLRDGYMPITVGLLVTLEWLCDSRLPDLAVGGAALRQLFRCDCILPTDKALSGGI